MLVDGADGTRDAHPMPVQQTTADVKPLTAVDALWSDNCVFWQDLCYHIRNFIVEEAPHID